MCLSEHQHAISSCYGAQICQLHSMGQHGRSACNSGPCAFAALVNTPASLYPVTQLQVPDQGHHSVLCQQCQQHNVRWHSQAEVQTGHTRLPRTEAPQKRQYQWRVRRWSSTAASLKLVGWASQGSLRGFLGGVLSLRGWRGGARGATAGCGEGPPESPAARMPVKHSELKPLHIRLWVLSDGSWLQG